VIPVSLVEAAARVSQNIPFHRENKQDPKRVIELLHQPLDPQRREWAAFTNTAVYSPVPYLPQAAGIFIARAFGLSPIAMTYAGRVSNLLVWACCGYICLRLLPVGHWTVALLALMPMTLYEVGSLSADASALAYSFLLIALCLRYALSEQPRIGARKLVPIFIVAILLSLSKTAYTPLVFLFLLIPPARLGGPRYFWTVALLLFAAAFGAGAAWPQMIHASDYSIVPGASFARQLANLRAHPSVALSFGSKWFSIGFLCSMVGKIGWYDTGIPRWLSFAWLFILLGVSLIDGSRDKLLMLRQKLLMAAVAYFTMLTMALLVFLMFTQAGSDEVKGLQARYLIPLSPLLLLLLYNRRFIGVVHTKLLARGVAIWIVFSSCVFIVLILRRFYIAG